MKKFTDWVVAHPWFTLGILLLLTAFFGYQLRKIKMNPDITESLPKTIPAKRLYDKMKEIFPSKDMILVIYQGDIFTPEGAGEIIELTSLLENFPEAYSVISPTNVKIIYGQADGIQIEEALLAPPQTPADIQQWRQRLSLNPSFLKSLIADNQKAAALMVFLHKDTDNDEFTQKLLHELENFNLNHQGRVFAAGEPVLNYYSSIGIARDMGIFFTAGILLIFFLLLVIFTSARGVFIPLTVVLASVVWTLGLMATMKKPISHATELLPILIMAIGIADSIHLLTHYYQKAASFQSSKALVREVMAELNAPVVMTSLTTMAGFVALNTSNMDSLEELGLFSAFGVFSALIWSLTFVPATLSLLKIKAGRRWREKKGRLSSFMLHYSQFLVKRKKIVALGVALILIMSALMITRLKVESSPITQFPRDNPVRQSAEFVNQHFAGTTTFYVLFEGDEDDYIKEPRVLQVMSALEDYIQQQPDVGATQSLAEFVKLLNKAVHNNDPAYYRIPQEVETETVETQVGQEVVKKTFQIEGKTLIAQLLQLYEMSASPEDFANLTDFNYRHARVAIFVRTDRDSRLRKIDQALQSFLDKNTDGVKAEITGMAKLFLIVRQMVIRGQFLSIVASLILVWLLTSLMFRSPIIGIFTTMPLFFGIFLNFATMGALGISLEIMTMVTSSLAIGIGVDYAIHFVHRYILELKHHDYSHSLQPSLLTSGVAITFNSIVVAAGFFLLILSMFKGIRAMGFLLALTMLTTAFAALTILPVYFITFKPKSLSHAAQRRSS
ncbi:MAG: hypothetical protein DRJ11_08080 [Candidatus Aminicenantes bacterium]|nr:MAG: hypothetical protein DRJ11_08080 [Candidatus Aminicenantes bacterium]